MSQIYHIHIVNIITTTIIIIIITILMAVVLFQFGCKF